LNGFNSARIGYYGSWSFPFNSKNELKIGDNSEIEIEINMNKKTIYYFVNKEQCPYYIYGVSSFGVVFGISGFNSNGIVDIISVNKLINSSVDNFVECEKIKWKIRKVGEEDDDDEDEEEEEY
jgi:hypothetical protein